MDRANASARSLAILVLYNNEISAKQIIDNTRACHLDVRDFAEICDHIMPGILEALALRCLSAAFNLMPTDILPPMAEVVEAAGAYKRERRDEQAARDALVLRYIARVNENAPGWAKRSMIAMIEFGLGNYKNSLINSFFARCELDMPDFENQLRSRSPAAIEMMLDLDSEQASVLASLIQAHKCCRA